MTIKFNEVPIGGLDFETFWGTVRERLCMLVKPRDMEEIGDTCRNLRSYNVLL